jgi:hypothetical protein
MKSKFANFLAALLFLGTAYCGPAAAAPVAEFLNGIIEEIPIPSYADYGLHITDIWGDSANVFLELGGTVQGSAPVINITGIGNFPHFGLGLSTITGPDLNAGPDFNKFSPTAPHLDAFGIAFFVFEYVDPPFTLGSLGLSCPTCTGATFVPASELTITLLTPVPIPATLPLFAAGLGLLGLLNWRRKRSEAALPG